MSLQEIAFGVFVCLVIWWALSIIIAVRYYNRKLLEENKMLKEFVDELQKEHLDG